MTHLAHRAASRLGFALALAFALAVGPTVLHSLWTEGPVVAMADLVTVVRWMVADVSPDLSAFTVVGRV